MLVVKALRRKMVKMTVKGSKGLRTRFSNPVRAAGCPRQGEYQKKVFLYRVEQMKWR